MPGWLRIPGWLSIVIDLLLSLLRRPRSVRWRLGTVVTIPAALQIHRRISPMQEVTMRVGQMIGPINVTAYDAGGNLTTYNTVAFSSDAPAAEVITVTGVEGVAEGRYVACRGTVGDATITATVDPTTADDDAPIFAQLAVHAMGGNAVTAEFAIGGLTPIPIPPGV